MKLSRMFVTAGYKGNCGYLDTQKKYEILRTVIYFGISLSLFVAGWITTGDKMNLLTIVAVLGCLPASKSAVQMIMFLRFRSLSADKALTLKEMELSLTTLFDMVFTSYERNFTLGHMAISGQTIIGFTENSAFSEKDFQMHLGQLLRNERISGASIKVFFDFEKYCERLRQLEQLEREKGKDEQIVSVLISTSL